MKSFRCGKVLRVTRLLLDTHIFLWALYEPEKLSPKATQLISDPHNIRIVSAASAWEISTKHRLGKLPMAQNLLQNYQGVLQRFMAEELPVMTKHSLLAGHFPQDHRDPFDRMLAAQSILEQVPLITADSAFQEFPVQVIW